MNSNNQKKMINKKFIKGTIWNTLGSAMYGLNSFLMLALVGRVGTVEETGCFGIAFTTAQLLYIVGLLGMNHYQQTDYQEKYPFSVYVRAKVIACILMVCGCVSVIFCLKFSGLKAIYTIILTVLMMLNAIGEMFQSLFFQKNRLDLSGGALFYRTFWSLSAFVVVAILENNILLALFIQIVVNLIITIYYAIRYTLKFTRYDRIDMMSGIRWAGKLILECFPLFVSLLLMNIVINSSKYGIEFLLDDKAQGYYNMIFMPAQVINLCSQFLFKPLLNQYSKVLTDNAFDKFTQMLKKQLYIVIGFTCVCCVAAYFLGTPILGMVFNKDLSEQRIALTLVVLGGGIFAISQLFYYIFVILRLQKQIMYIYIFALISTVIVTYFLVKYFGINGASMSFILTQTIILVSYLFLLKRTLRYKKKILSRV